MIDYPDELLRGVPSNSDEFITPEGVPTQAVFKFDDYDDERGDNFCELSINWVDDDGAVDLLLKQINKRKQCLQFQGGYCRLSKSALHIIMKVYFDNRHLDYERRPMPADEVNEANPYHGNILMNNDLSKPARMNIRAALACIAGSVIPRDT